MPDKRSKKQKAKSKNVYGFTLIEFVIVMGILGFVVTSTVLFLNSVLRGANQTNITQEVKQNGQAVLDSLDKQIRGAVAVVGVPPQQPDLSYKEIVLTRPNDNSLDLKCFDPVSPSQNGYIGSLVPPASSYTSISNNDLVNGVNITNCKFNIVSAAVSAQGVQNPAIVTVSFVVSQGIDAPGRQDFVASAPFQTTISLRTY